MGRPREINKACRQIGGLVEEDDLNIVMESMGRKPISELLREIFKSIADEERKKKQFQQQVSNPYRNSAIAISLPTEVEIENKKQMTPSMVNEYLRQVIEYVSNTENDIYNLQSILSNAKQICEQVKIRIRKSFETPTDKRLKGLNAAISKEAWDKARKQEYQQKRQQLEEEYIPVKESEELIVEEDEEIIS